MELQQVEQRILSLLESDDLEMIQLGVILLENENRHISEMRDILDAHLNKHFLAHIIDGKILIEIVKRGLWEQLETGYKHSYNTQMFSLQTLKDAISNYYKTNTI